MYVLARVRPDHPVHGCKHSIHKTTVALTGRGMTCYVVEKTHTCSNDNYVHVVHGVWNKLRSGVANSVMNQFPS